MIASALEIDEELLDNPQSIILNFTNNEMTQCNNGVNHINTDVVMEHLKIIEDKLQNISDKLKRG